MIPLYAPLPYSVDYGGKTYRLLPYYDRVIEAMDAIQRRDITPEDALGYALRLLIYDKKPPIDFGLLQAVFDTLIEPARTKAQRSVDFTQDAALIYSAFMQAYHIDLREARDMHWWTFSALLSGLPSDTRLMEIVRIRTMPVPEPTKYNGDRIQEIMRLKTLHGIRYTPEEAEDNFNRDLQELGRKVMSA